MADTALPGIDKDFEGLLKHATAKIDSKDGREIRMAARVLYYGSHAERVVGESSINAVSLKNRALANVLVQQYTQRYPERKKRYDS